MATQFSRIVDYRTYLLDKISISMTSTEAIDLYIFKYKIYWFYPTLVELKVELLIQFLSFLTVSQLHAQQYAALPSQFDVHRISSNPNL